MRTSLHNSLSRGALTLVALVAFASPVFGQANQEKAARHALYGPEVKKLKVMGHEFNVKKAKITRSAGGMTTVTGQLSHCLTLRPDDQLYYTIRKSGTKVVSMDIKIDRGGLAVYVSKLANHFIGHPTAVGSIESLVRDLGRKVDGKWESSADLIVATIALRTPAGYSPQDDAATGSTGQVRDHRTPRPMAPPPARAPLRATR